MELTYLVFVAVYVCVGTVGGQTNPYDKAYPIGRRCGIKYSTVLQKRGWVCNEAQYQAYPTQKVNACIASGKYKAMTQYLTITKSCHTYHDFTNVYGTGEYYNYTSLCKMKREPVQVIWAQVPGYSPTPQEYQLNYGLLPVHVIKGQSLYDIDCVHPLSDGGDLSYLKTYVLDAAKRIKWNELKRRYCHVGYTYNSNLVCAPSGFINRDVVVYSQHADILFKVRIPNVPTSCSCTKCKCL